MKNPVAPGPLLATAFDRGVYAIAGAFVLVCALFVLGDYQNHGGDFGQYITQARNVIWGRPWSYLMEGYPAVLPGYSFLLAVPTALFGVNYHAYALINTVLWATLSVVCYRMYAPRFQHAATRIGFFAALLGCPYVLYYQQQTNPVILYAAVVSLALWAVNDLVSTNTRLSRLRAALPVVLLLLPAIVRTDSIALYLAVFAFLFLQRHWRLLGWPVLGVTLTVTLDLFIGSAYDQGSNFGMVLRTLETSTPTPTPTPNAVADAPTLLQSIPYMLIAYINGLSIATLPSDLHNMGSAFGIAFGPDLERSVSTPTIVLFCCCILGMLRGRLTNCDKLFFFAHLCMLSMFFLFGPIRVRYVLPLVPIFLFYSIGFVEWAMLRAARAVPLRTIDLGRVAPILLTTIILGTTTLGVVEYHRLPADDNYTVTPDLTEVIELVVKQDAGAGIAYYKPRPMTMLLDRADRSTPSIPARILISPSAADKYLQTPGFLLVVRKIGYYGQTDVLNFLLSSPRAEPILHNDQFVVFRAKSVAS